MRLAAAGLLAGLWMGLAALAGGAEIPAIMILTGKLASRPGLSPTAGDRVLAFSAHDGSWVGDGTVSAAGHYTVIAARTASFNGTPVVLELQQGRFRYALLREGGAAASLPFAGRMLPERTNIDLAPGAQTAELSPAQALAPQAQRLSRRADLPCDAASDINRDGRCDDADWAILGLYGGGISRSVGRP